MTDFPDIEPALNDAELKEKLKNEIAPVAWEYLQILFARGVCICVSAELDMVEVAFQISRDNKALVEQWMNEGKLKQIQDHQAAEWFEANTELVTAIVKPWILVQEPA